ncbi:MAG: hypothetical protein GY868_14065, partial [Deltaproteobacteria bacterium]|nr:hypothetical protein [Deltaproteobacteria bacterium]
LGKVEAEKELIAYALKLCNDDYAETARRLGIGRSSFYDKLKAYGLVPGAKPNGGRN